MTIKHLFPPAWPTLNLDFANSKSLDPRITFSRSSIGTYVDADGIIQTAADDEARFDHDPVTGESLGLLVEESRTNETHPSTFTSASVASSWAIVNDTYIIPDQILSPSGENTGALLDFDTANTDGVTFQLNLAANTPQVLGTRVYSAWVKPVNTGVGTFISLRFQGAAWSWPDGGTSTRGIRFYFDTKSFEINSSPASSSNKLAFEEYPNDWYRISIPATNSGAGYVSIRANENTAGNCYMWGFQSEEGSFSTSLIPTSGSAEDRSADVCSIEGDNFTSWFNQAEGTFVGTVGSRSRLLLSSVSTGPNVYQDTTYSFYSNSESYGASFNLRYEDQSQVLVNYSGWTSSIPMQNYAGAYSAEGVAGAWEGNLGNPQTPLNKPLQDDLSHMWIGRNHSVTDSGVQRISRLAYYPTRLSDEQLQALTS